MCGVVSNHQSPNPGRARLAEAWPAIVVLAAILSTGLFIIDDSGIGYDEIHGIDVLSRNYELVVNDIPINGVYRFDGTIFNFAAEGVYQFYKRALVSDARQVELERDMLAAFHTRIRTKHIVTFVTSIVAYACVAAMVGIICGWRYAWVGPVVLVLMPRFLGHSFFNFKDVPFAAFFTLCSLAGAYLVNRAAFTGTPGTSERAGRSLMGMLAAYGLLVAVLTGIRFGGFIHLAFPVVALILVVLAGGVRGGASIYRLTAGYGVCLLCWLAGTILFYPYLWEDPLQGVLEMVRAMSDYPWKGRVLFNGEFIRGYNLPDVYLPVWLILTTPVLTLVASAAGLVWLLGRWTSLTPLSRILVVFLFLQAFALPLATTFGDATYYNGLRHFLFTLPAFAAAAAVCLVWLHNTIKRRIGRAAFACLLALAYVPVGLDMAALHPYEYIYFNRAFGGLESAAHRFGTDYWGLSLREGGEWLARNAEPGAAVVVGGPLHSVRPFTGRNMELIPLEDVKNGRAPYPAEPFYYIARPRLELHYEFGDCPKVFAVERQQTLLTIIKKCGGDR